MKSHDQRPMDLLMAAKSSVEADQALGELAILLPMSPKAGKGGGPVFAAENEST